MKVFWLWWTMEVICIQLSNLDVKNKWPPSYRKNFQKKKKPKWNQKRNGNKGYLKKNDKKCDPNFLSQSFWI